MLLAEVYMFHPANTPRGFYVDFTWCVCWVVHYRNVFLLNSVYQLLLLALLADGFLLGLVRSFLFLLKIVGHLLFDCESYRGHRDHDHTRMYLILHFFSNVVITFVKLFKTKIKYLLQFF